MEEMERKCLYGFFENELKSQILPFWMPRCEDKEWGGFLNCFGNDSTQLFSYDKYTWSQGRFVWLFSRLAAMEAPLFSAAERQEFLRLAGQGADFLTSHCLIGEDDWRCVFLMERNGRPKYVEGCDRLDMSIYADCFVVIGLARYALVSGNQEKYRFAKNLHHSCVQRIKENNFCTLPYPLSSCYRAHGIPMIMDNTTKELYLAAQALDPEYSRILLEEVEAYARDVLTNFVDSNYALREVISHDNHMLPNILGQHMNPGHTIEDTWFMLEAAELCQKQQWTEKILAVAKHAFQVGWDDQYGGILHFCALQGGEPQGDSTGVAAEKMVEQLAGWGDKLWWVHSEALYTSLLCYQKSRNPDFLNIFKKVFAYTFSTFPNRNPEVREWIQIRERSGKPAEKVVALPVKDPFHIIRNLIMLLELLHKEIPADFS